MEPLVNGNPGLHECWEELAEHALTHDDLNAIAERVAAGMAFLDERDPDWWRADVERAIDLDDLDLRKTDACILGQRCPLETLADAVGVDDPEELGSIDFGEAYYVNAARLNPGLPDRLALAKWADANGFCGEVRDYPWLTAEWRRVIEARRSA